MLKKGPELKLPDIKVPDFLLDLYYDLRERRLLPLVGVLLVAIVALPIALSGSSDSEPETSTSEGIATLSSTPSSKLVVAKAAPGLRDYRRRLSDGTPKDPFAEPNTGSESGSASATTTSGEGEGESTETESPSVTLESTSTETTSTSNETAEAVPPSNGNGEPTNPGQPRYFSFAADIRIVPVSSGASTSKAEASVRRNLPELTMLPSRDTPALTFMGVTKDKKKALMLVSDKVTGLFGDGICAVGSERCQLLVLEQGIPETVVYGVDQRTFRIELLKLRLLTTDKPNEAPLSKPKEKKSGRESKEHSAG
jgi:hypothetical protein